MSEKTEKVTISVDASIFSRQLGESVKQGEIVGQRGGKDVTAPFDALIKAASFNSDDHTLEVVLIRETPSP